VKFKSESGHFVLIQAHLPNGATLPFGAEVTDEQGQPIGVVGQAGRIMVRTAHEIGRLNVQWQDQDLTRVCSFAYRLQPRAESRRGIGAIEQIDATCEQPHDAAQVAGSGT
jgi:outer membrane usher protein